VIKLSFVCGSGLSSKLISWWGQGYNGWSHVDAVLPDGTLLGARDDSPGGTKPGVQIRPANYETWARRDVLELETTPTQAFSWEVYLRAQVGKPYDQAAILGFILGKADHDSGHWICSALQTAALEKVGILPAGFSDSIATSQVAPNALHLLALGLGAKRSTP